MIISRVMAPHERQEMLESLERSREALLQAVQGVTEEQAARTPAAGRWSILQCVEHVAVVEDYLLGQVVNAHQAEAPLLNEKREALIRARAADRERRVPAPELARPVGRFATLAEATQGFLQVRARTIEFVESSSSDLRCQVTSHPILGTVNCYENLLMIAAHPQRHAGQIAEIRAALWVAARSRIG